MENYNKSKFGLLASPTRISQRLRLTCAQNQHRGRSNQSASLKMSHSKAKSDHIMTMGSGTRDQAIRAYGKINTFG
jgi:hypothetical protein